jgi:hypothetical protein
MAKKTRGRRPRPLEVTNLEPLGASIPDWERELLRSALKRLDLEPRGARREEVHDGGAE